MSRIDRLQRRLPELELDHFLVTHIQHIRYLTGYSGEEGHLIVSGDRAVFLCDPRFVEQAEQEVSDCQIVTHPENLPLVLPDLKLRGIIGIESLHISVGELERIGAVLPNCTFQAADKVIDVIAAVKDPEEIDAIRQAIAISERAFTEVLGIITEGVTERDLAAELTYRQMKMGADKDSFDIIVASGPRGALPHGTASHKKVEAGDLIVFDWGCFTGGYPSDMTRMVVLGKATDRMRDIHRIVLDAQQLALDAVKTGINVSELDRIARDYITDRGFGKEFGHPLGHGLGLDIHSYPRVSQHVDYPLPANAVITIEPGIYIPGWGGVRIEEDVRVTDDGADVLTSLSRELVEIELP